MPKLKTTSQNDDINIGLQSSTSNQEITLLMGSDDNAINRGVLTFQENINSNIIVNKKDSILTSDSHDILIIFSHGTEKGMIFNDELIFWADLSILLSQTNAKFIFLATCYGANINKFSESTDKNIIGWSGVSDAIWMGYVIALVVNVNFQYLDDALANVNSINDRDDQISKHPEQIIPLMWTKIELIERFWWIILVRSSIILHMRFTEAEEEFISTGSIFLEIGLNVLGLFLAPGIAASILFIFGLYIANIMLAIDQSSRHHSDGGAWISFEFFGLPPIGTFVHGRASSGSIVYQMPMDPNPLSGVAMKTILMNYRHDWTWRSI